MPHQRHKSDDVKAHTIKSCDIHSKNVTTRNLVVTGTISAPRLDSMECAAQRQQRHMQDELNQLLARVSHLEDCVRFQNVSDGQVVITGAPLVIRPA